MACQEESGDYAREDSGQCPVVYLAGHGVGTFSYTGSRNYEAFLYHVRCLFSSWLCSCGAIWWTVA